MIARLAQIALGIWVMVAPAVIGYRGALATSDRIAGPLIIAFAAIATAEVLRALRIVLVPLGLWLVFAPFALDGSALACGNGVLAGVATAGLSFWATPARAQMGGGWRVLWDASQR